MIFHIIGATGFLIFAGVVLIYAYYAISSEIIRRDIKGEKS